MHQRPKFLCRPRSYSTSFANAGIVSSLLSKRLIEPGLDKSLPILSEMGVRHDSVSFANHDELLKG